MQTITDDETENDAPNGSQQEEAKMNLSLRISEVQQRNDWKIGSNVSIYSNLQAMWMRGVIIQIQVGAEGEWLGVKYGDTIREMQRFSEWIKPTEDGINNKGQQRSAQEQLQLDEKENDYDFDGSDIDEILKIIEMEDPELKLNEKNNQQNDAVTVPSSLKEFTLEHLLSLIMDHNVFDDKTINPFKNKIIDYLKENKVNGQMLSSVKKKEFAQRLIKYNNNNPKIRGAANKTWTRFINYHSYM